MQVSLTRTVAGGSQTPHHQRVAAGRLAANPHPQNPRALHRTGVFPQNNGVHRIGLLGSLPEDFDPLDFGSDLLPAPQPRRTEERSHHSRSSTGSPAQRRSMPAPTAPRGTPRADGRSQDSGFNPLTFGTELIQQMTNRDRSHSRHSASSHHHSDTEPTARHPRRRQGSSAQQRRNRVRQERAVRNMVRVIPGTTDIVPSDFRGETETVRRNTVNSRRHYRQEVTVATGTATVVDGPGDPRTTETISRGALCSRRQKKQKVTVLKGTTTIVDGPGDPRTTETITKNALCKRRRHKQKVTVLKGTTTVVDGPGDPRTTETITKNALDSRKRRARTRSGNRTE